MDPNAHQDLCLSETHIGKICKAVTCKAETANRNPLMPTKYMTQHVITKMMAGWEINVPFQHKNRLYRGQGLGWRFSSAKLPIQ